MEWTEAIKEAVSYIENHITENITMYDVASHVNISPFYFNKGFSILCGYSMAEYIIYKKSQTGARRRRTDWKRYYGDSACDEVWI